MTSAISSELLDQSEFYVRLSRERGLGGGPSMIAEVLKRALRLNFDYLDHPLIDQLRDRVAAAYSPDGVADRDIAAIILRAARDGGYLPDMRWEFTFEFTNGDSIWTQRLTAATYAQAKCDAESLCYEPTTRFRLTDERQLAA